MCGDLCKKFQFLLKIGPQNPITDAHSNPGHKGSILAVLTAERWGDHTLQHLRKCRSLSGDEWIGGDHLCPHPIVWERRPNRLSPALRKTAHLF
jgi:hypothetical protein